eukprot:356197_1
MIDNTKFLKKIILYLWDKKFTLTLRSEKDINHKQNNKDAVSINDDPPPPPTPPAPPRIINIEPPKRPTPPLSSPSPPPLPTPPTPPSTP